jgi:hypothetical protein
VFSGEATNTNFIVFGLTWPGLEPMIYRTRGKHAYHHHLIEWKLFSPWYTGSWKIVHSAMEINFIFHNKIMNTSHKYIPSLIGFVKKGFLIKMSHRRRFVSWDVRFHVGLGNKLLQMTCTLQLLLLLKGNIMCIVLWELPLNCMESIDNFQIFPLIFTCDTIYISSDTNAYWQSIVTFFLSILINSLAPGRFLFFPLSLSYR